ncbi:MAG: leucine-rich repeat protein, partial [Prevotella sp.]|nr:leucine-rich repeat protein [Prevotella sp.]
MFGNQVEQFIIGSDVTSIGSSAFCGCLGLTTMIIPNSVTSMGSSVFEG